MKAKFPIFGSKGSYDEGTMCPNQANYPRIPEKRRVWQILLVKSIYWRGNLEKVEEKK
jgi:hypothetical protein